MEHWWNDTDRGKLKNWVKNPTDCYFVHHKSKMEWPGIETRISRCLKVINLYYSVPTGDRGCTVVKVLCYKSGGRWFDPSWCHWNSSLI